jgi:hypothetical protein
MCSAPYMRMLERRNFNINSLNINERVHYGGSSVWIYFRHSYEKGGS